MFVLAILNLALGYGAALALAEPPPWSGWRIRLPKLRIKPAGGAAPARRTEESKIPIPIPREAAAQRVVIEPAVPPIAAPAVAGLDELPADWLQRLAREGIVAQSFVEATAHVLRLEVGRY